MNLGSTRLYDPTSELESAQRPRVAPTVPLSEATVGLFDLGKIRSDEFLDYLAEALADEGIKTARFAKPTNAKPATVEILDSIAASADVAVEALAD